MKKGYALLLSILSALMFTVVGARAEAPAVVTTLHGGFAYGNFPLVLGHDNLLYGTTTGAAGNYNSFGIIFQMAPDGSGFTVLHTFTAAEQSGRFDGYAGGDPHAYGPSIIQGADNSLYGISFSGTNYPYGMVFKLNRNDSTLTVLHVFTNWWTQPYSLIQGSGGTLYGTSPAYIFTLDTNGSNFHLFTAEDRNLGKLVQVGNGTLYGTSFQGGTGTYTTSGGEVGGTVYKINPDGSGFAVLHNFSDYPDAGAMPSAGLIEGSDGALYGTTTYGGTNNAGTIFKLNQDGSGYQVLHSFKTDGIDGQNPVGALVEGSDHMLYGTTSHGGTNNNGIVFRIALDGSGYSILHNFGAGSFSGYPLAAMVQGVGSNGSIVFYGTTAIAVFSILVNPPLSITPVMSQTGSSPMLTWPSWAAGYELQSTTNLADTNSWTMVTNGIPVTGLQLTNHPASAYYRLIWR